MALLDDLKWRYATKKMSGRAVPQDKLDYILEAARHAPSSSGLQPYRIFVISDKKILEQIRTFSFDQSQVTDCSHLLVWASWANYTERRISEVLQHTAKERDLPSDTSDDYRKMLWDLYEPLGQEWHKNHAAKQAYISFSLAIAAAAEQRVDTTPMEGFDQVKLDKLLGFDQAGLKSVVILPVGYRTDDGDWLVNLKKVRTPKNSFITEIK